MTRVSLFGLAASALILAAPTTGGTTTLACRPGVREVTYAFRYIPVPTDGADRFHDRLGAWAEQTGLSVGGVEGEDPGQKPVYRSRTSILQSPRYGVVIYAESDNRKRHIKLAIGNNCWAPAEPWRPWWNRLQAWLDRG
jgi:hypothetical protein